MFELTPEQSQRFFSKVRKGTGCWLWQGASSRPPEGTHRYGTFRVGAKVLKAHRVAYVFGGGGSLSPGENVLHTCDNTLCVKPSHLFKGTHIDNMRDMIAKGRAGGKPEENRRKTHCHLGHPLYGDNLYLRKNGQRQCRICLNEATRRYRERAKLTPPAEALGIDPYSMDGYVG